jgi:hypothetical protein
LHELAARDVLIVLFGDLDGSDSVDKSVPSHTIKPFDQKSQIRLDIDQSSTMSWKVRYCVTFITALINAIAGHLQRKSIIKEKIARIKYVRNLEVTGIESNKEIVPALLFCL